MSNPWEASARGRKVWRLAQAAQGLRKMTEQQLGVDISRADMAAVLESWDDLEWGALARNAGCRPASETTRAQVVAFFRGGTDEN